MSLVVLRSWSDGPPKVRGIAPSDSNEKYVYVPDHRGQFVTEEVVTLRPQNDQKVKAGAIRRQTWNGGDNRSHNEHEDGMDNNGLNHIATVKETIGMHEGDGDDDDEEDYNYGNNNNNAAEQQRSSSIGAKLNGGAGVTRRRVGGGSDCKSSTERNYKSLSYIDLNSEERVEHISKSTTTIAATETITTSKNRWANETRKPALLKPNKPTVELQHQRASSRSSSISPDNNDYIHELDSTPPASPMLNGRYRNLGPELAACIPKRQLKFSTNWLQRDGPNSLGYQWSHQRRSLSNSTPSLSQDFYSSEEEKISSFSSQSSSKTSSPQPPSPSIRQLQRQFEKQSQNHQQNQYKEPEGSITEEEERQVISPRGLSDFPWADGANRLKKIDKNVSPAGKNYYNRRPRQRQLVSSPSTPPPPPPDQHDYYRSLSSTPSGTRISPENSKDELDSPGKLRGVLGKQLSLSSEDETNDNNNSARGGSPGKSDVILVEVIRKKLKAKNNSNNNSQTQSSGFSASGSDSGSDKDSVDSGCHQSIISGGRKSTTSEGKSLKSILKNSVTSTYATTAATASPQRNEEVVKNDQVKSDDVNENLCELQLVGADSSTEAEQIEQDRSLELVDKNNCVIPTTRANKAQEEQEEQQKDHQVVVVSTSQPSPSPSSLHQESKIIRNRESEVFDSVIASTVVAAVAIAVESERKETEEGAEIQDGVQDKNEKGVEKTEEGEEALQLERPPVEISVPPVRNNDEAQFSASSSSNSEQNPRLSALPITDEKKSTTTDCCGTNQSESIQQETAKDESVSSSGAESDVVLLLGRSETNVEVASRILDQVLTQAERTIEQISSNKSSVSSVESTPMDRGKFFEDHSPIATVKIPVQAVNKYVRSDSSDEFESDFIWRKSSVRESFRGFCQELLESSSSTGSSHEALNNEVRAKATEKIVIHVSQPQPEPQSLLPTQAINEGVIEFEDDDDGADHHHHHHGSELTSNADRAETPMQQCNNSIEYISVRDNVQQVNGAVNAERSSRTEFREPGIENGLSINPQPIKWIITLDLGSRSSGFSYWGHVDQNVVHIGSWSGDNCLHKIPSWILTSTEVSSSSQKPAESVSAVTVKIGQEALDEYMEQGDSKCAFVNQWREFFQLDPEAAKLLTFPYTLDSAEDEMEFAHLITSLVNFFGKAAVSQMQVKFGPAFDTDEHVEWLITVPSGWNSHSRQCIREAAYKSPVIKDTDGVNLIEDPIAAAVFASMCGKYDNVMAVDVGGAFIHYSGFSSTVNGRLVQTLEPNSLPLRTPESNFEQLLTQIVSREFMLYYKAKYKAGWVELLRNFERAKCKFDMSNTSSSHQPVLSSSFTSTSSSAFVFFPSSFVTEFHGYTGMDLAECIQEQNSGMTWNENGALRIPYEQMKQILKPTVDTVVGRIESALKEYDYDNLVLTGGCAKCRYLNETISAQFPGLKIILPKEFSSGVLQGATLSLMPNLEPKLLIKSPFSIGVGVMTPFDPNQHPEEKKIIKDGKTWCADVWDTLIKHGQDMEINSVVNRRAYVGAQPGQSCLVLPLFKSSAPGVPKLVTDKSVLKCCELRFDSTKTWHEIDLVLTCRASELIVMAVDRENLVHRVVIDIL